MLRMTMLRCITNVSDSVGVKCSGLRHYLGWQPALFMNADVGPELWRVLLQKLAKGDPLPIFLKSFYNNEVGKEATEARAGSLAPFFRARSLSGHKIAKFLSYLFSFFCVIFNSFPSKRQNSFSNGKARLHCGQ